MLEIKVLEKIEGEWFRCQHGERKNIKLGFYVFEQELVIDVQRNKTYEGSLLRITSKFNDQFLKGLGQGAKIGLNINGLFFKLVVAAITPNHTVCFLNVSGEKQKLREQLKLLATKYEQEKKRKKKLEKAHFQKTLTQDPHLKALYHIGYRTSQGLKEVKKNTKLDSNNKLWFKCSAPSCVSTVFKICLAENSENDYECYVCGKKNPFYF